ATERLDHVLRLAGAGSEDHGGVTVVRLARTDLLAFFLHFDFAFLVRPDADDLAAFERQNGDRHVAAVGSEHARHAHFLCDDSGAHQPLPSLISTATPAERSSFMRASTVCGVGSTMSRTRLWVRISNCSRAFLSTWGGRWTGSFPVRVGSGAGPRTWAPVRLAVETISRAGMSGAR